MHFSKKSTNFKTVARDRARRSRDFPVLEPRCSPPLQEGFPEHDLISDSEDEDEDDHEHDNSYVQPSSLEDYSAFHD